MNIAVVIAAYNESKRIRPVLKAIPRTVNGHTVSVIVVDDGSKDNTAKQARDVQGITVARHPVNLGKGAALKTGCEIAFERGADFFVVMDADGQHLPEDIGRIVAPVISDPKSLSIGTREFSKEMPIVMRVGNKGFAFVMRVFFGILARDTQSGFRAFSRAVYPKIRWDASNYAMEVEMLMLAVKNEVRFAEVPIKTIYLDSHKGTTPLDGIRILKAAFKQKILWSRGYK